MGYRTSLNPPPTTPPPPPIKSTPRGIYRAPKQRLTDITYRNKGYGARDKSVANGVINLNQTKYELAVYLAAALFNPAKFILLRAICRNHLTTWPGLTAQMIAKHLLQRIATAKGHLDQEFKNLRSTKSTPPPETQDPHDPDISPPQEPANPKTQNMLCTIIDSAECKDESYSDQTGEFPVRSVSGNQ